jgi:hypothetical protein
MKQNYIMKKMAIGTLALNAAIGTMTYLPLVNNVNILAKEGDTLASSATVKNGTSDLGGGYCSIKINANDGQTLVGKKFTVYQLFTAENSKDLESINYTWNTKYKTALQNVVGKALSKTASKVTKYEVIDYMQSINENYVEGAQVSQDLEGRYSSFRYFVEDVRNEIVLFEFRGTTNCSLTARTMKTGLAGMPGILTAAWIWAGCQKAY